MSIKALPIGTMLMMCSVVHVFHPVANAQVCIDGSNKPPRFEVDGIPHAWPKTVAAAQTYVGHVEYQIFTGLIYVNGAYYSSSPNYTIMSAISNAASEWNLAASQNGSTVYLQEVSTPPDNNGGPCSPAPDCINYYTPFVQFLQYKNADMQGNIARIVTSWWNYSLTGAYDRLGNATVTYTDSITNGHYMQFAAAHELGHSFALQDCPNCTPGGSIMTGQVSLNSPFSLIAPSYCDNQAVAQYDIAQLQLIAEPELAACRLSVPGGSGFTADFRVGHTSSVQFP